MKKSIRLLAIWIAVASLCAPACAQMMMTGVGSLGGSNAYGPLTPPTLTPQLSASLDANIATGINNNGWKVNGGGAAGSFQWPSTLANSVFWTMEGTIDASLSGYSNNESIFGPALYISGGNPSVFNLQNGYDGTGFRWWTGLTALAPGSGSPPFLTANPGTYNSGIYTATATGGGCTREPTVAWSPVVNQLNFIDPGFNCSSAPTLDPVTVAGVGSQQPLTTGATTCVNNSPITGVE